MKDFSNCTNYGQYKLIQNYGLDDNNVGYNIGGWSHESTSNRESTNFYLKPHQEDL